MALMKHKTEITLYNSYFDLNDRLSAKSILSIFQDVASVHGEEIGVGYKPMLEKNLYWILSRIKFDILKMPQINQKVVVETWPHEKGRIDFDRDFKISSLTGEVLLIGTSKWCVIDTEKRMLQRTDNISYQGECCPDKNYPDHFGKISLPNIPQKFKFSYRVRFSDLDHNKHMNNTNYASLILSAVENTDFSHFEINFINECLLNQEIQISSIKSQLGEYVVGTIDGKTAFTSFIQQKNDVILS